MKTMDITEFVNILPKNIIKHLCEVKPHRRNFILSKKYERPRFLLSYYYAFWCFTRL